MRVNHGEEVVNHILIIAHQPLASALRACALHVFPELASCISAFDVPGEQSREISFAQVQAILPLDREVLICTDVCGATPFNIAQDLANANGCELLTGANVPMVVRGLGYSHEPMAKMIDKAIEGARQGIMLIEASAVPPCASEFAGLHL